MSTQEHLYLYTERSLPELAGELAAAVGMRIVYEDRAAAHPGGGGEHGSTSLKGEREQTNVSSGDERGLTPSNDGQPAATHLSGDAEQARIYLTRALPDGEGHLGGELHTNELADQDSFVGAFPLVLSLGVTVGDRALQAAEARHLFAELSDGLRITAALARGHDFLVGFTSPATGLIWFPEGVTPYAEDREFWLPLTTHLGGPSGGI